MAWPPSRQRLIARAWRIITPHRIRTGCTHAWMSEGPADGGPGWPYLDQDEEDGRTKPGEPPLHYGSAFG